MKERSPYKYLDYYTFEDADIFFGREEETQRMVGEILSTRLLVLFSPSGSGKTSLINAGVVPKLKRLGYETLYVRFESDPLTSLQNAAREQLQHAGAANDLRGLLQNVTAARKKPLVVFLDQFEEFFLVFADQPALRQDFMAQIAAVKYDEQLPVFLVLSLREDYYASLHEFRSAVPSIFQNNANIRLGAFTDDEAKRAILLPLAAVGLQMEAGLAEKIIHDLKPSRNGQERRDDNASGIEPITLQIVCHKLWQMKPRDAATMTAAVYEKCGGAQKILRNHVSELLQKIPQRQQGLVVRVFEALKTRDNTKLYRRLQDLQETLRLTDSHRLKNALQKLAEIGVLRHEQRSGDDWYEFKHDYLVNEVTEWLNSKEKKNKKRNSFIYGVLLAPIIYSFFLFLLMLPYYIYNYNTFYAGFTALEYQTQQPEIAISRVFNPFRELLTTELLLKDVQDFQAQNELREKFRLGFWKRNDWSRLMGKLNLAKSGEFLYKSGQIQAGIDTLVAALKDQKVYVRAQATGALVKLGQSDDRVVDALVAALKDQNEHVRAQAAGALGRLGQSDDRVVGALLAVLKDQDGDVRAQAAGALGKLGQSDDRVVGALVAALKDQDGDVRAQAAAALGNLGNSDDRVISALVVALKDQDSDVRSQAAAALVNLGNSDDRVISALVAALKDQDSAVRYQAAAALGNLGNSDDRVISALVAALKDQNQYVRRQAADALVNLGKSDDRVISALVAALKDQNEYVRSQAAAALGNLGNSDDRVISALVAALKDQNQYVRRQAADALVNLGKSDDRVISALVAALKDQNEYVRSQAAAALGNLGNSDDRVISALVAALKDNSWDVRRQAAAALGNLGNSDDRVISALVAALKDNSWDVRRQAAAALVNLGNSDDRVISALVAALKDNNWDVSSQAAAALGNLLKPKLEDELLELLANNLSGYRSAGAQALARKDSLSLALLARVDQLRQNDRPWVRLAAWETHELIQARLKSEAEAQKLLRQADSVFALPVSSNQFSVASGQYEKAFDILKNIIRVDSAKTARAKFQQARCAAKLKRVGPALDDLKIAFEYNPTLRDTLQAELAQPNNDWVILQGNWYLWEVLLKIPKSTPK